MWIQQSQTYLLHKVLTDMAHMQPLNSHFPGIPVLAGCPQRYAKKPLETAAVVFYMIPLLTQIITAVNYIGICCYKYIWYISQGFVLEYPHPVSQWVSRV